MISITRIQNSIFASNTYILRPSVNSNVILIDCGDVDQILSCLEKNEIIESVYLTHTHSDHIYGLDELLNLYPNLSIYTNQYGKQALGSPQLNLSRYHEEYPDIEIKSANVLFLSEGESLSLYDDKIKVYSTPGHDPSCLSYVIGDYIFTGDSYIPGVKVHSNFPKGDKNLAMESLERLKILSENKIICPGHGQILDNQI